MNDQDTRLLELCKRRYETDSDADKQDAADASKDQLFHAGENQWDADVKEVRKSSQRPCLTINKMPNYVDQISGDIRQNKPAIKVKPIDSGADPAIAEIYDGLICNIETRSRAHRIYASAAESAVICGRGHFRVLTDYVSDDVFEQEIMITPIPNAFSVTWDCNSKRSDMSDAQHCTLTELISEDAYKAKYPSKAPVDFDLSGEEKRYWQHQNMIRVAEQYYFKTGKEIDLYLVKETSPTGQTSYKTVNELLAGQEPVRTRKVRPKELWWVKFSGKEVLDGPKKQPGKFIPVCSVWGKESFIASQRRTRGIIRYAKDSQRMYNYFRSTHAERMALEPKAPYLIGMSQIDGFEDVWNRAQTDNLSHLPFDDTKNPNPPQRQFPEPMGQGIQQEVMLADQEMHDTTGLQQASLGEKSNERSGKAIMARQREGDTSSYPFIDNLTMAIEYCGRILIDLIPKIYDTERVIRVLGEDSLERFVPINTSEKMFSSGYDGPRSEPNAKGLINDLTDGKYDVTVTVGPGYTTKRIEAAESMLMFVQQVPQAGQFIADLIAKNMDWPGAKEIEQRFKKILPPGMIETKEGEQPPQLTPPPPDPSLQIKEGELKLGVETLQFQKEKFAVESQLKAKELQIKETGAEAKAIKDLVDAKTAAIGSDLAQIKQFMESLTEQQKPQGGSDA